MSAPNGNPGVIADFEESPEMEALDTSFLLREERLPAESEDEDDASEGMDPRPAFRETYRRSPEVAAAFDEGATQILQIPGPLLSWEDKELWRRCVLNEWLGLPPATRAELVIRQTRNGVIAANLGRKVSPEMVMAAVLVSLAKVRGVAIETPLRGIARHMGVRYTVFLKVRRIALAVIDRHRVEFGLSIA